MSEKFTVENGHEGVLPAGKYRIIDGELFKVSDCPMESDLFAKLEAELAQAKAEIARLNKALPLHEEKDRIANQNIVAMGHEISRLQAELSYLKGFGHRCGHCGKFCFCDEESHTISDSDCHCDPDMTKMAKENERLQAELTTIKSQEPESDQCGQYHAWMEQRVGQLIEEKGRLQAEVDRLAPLVTRADCLLFHWQMAYLVNVTDNCAITEWLKDNMPPKDETK